MLICPICAEPLAPTGATLVCSRHHTFDIAREGYVNVLVGKIRGDEGDTKEMLRARRSFLERGFYAPLSERVNVLAATCLAGYLGNGAAPVVLDAGCGEGYYLGRLRAALQTHPNSGSYSYLGIDIAKEAVRLAAKRYRDIRFAVADVKRGIPAASDSVALLLSVFAPRNPAELARVVAPGGVLLAALPGPHHLMELRERYGLIGIEPEKERHLAAQLAPAFARTSSVSLAYPMSLTGEDIRHLLVMTPNARHRERQGWRDTTPEAMQVTASFLVLAFQRIRTA